MKTWVIATILALIATPVAADAGTLAIGVVLPMSGQTARYGMDALRGINLAVEEINARGGIRENTLTLAVRDNGGSPGLTSQVVESLINRDNVLAIVGPITSTNAAAAAAVAQQEKTPLVLPTATSPYVTEIGEYICRICFTDPIQSRALVEFSRRHLRATRAAVVFEGGSAYSDKLAELYVAQFQDAGGQIVFIDTLPQDRSDVAALLKRAFQEAPDLLFAPVYYTDAASIVNAAAAIGNTATLLGGDGWDSPEFLRATGDKIPADQVYISAHFSLDWELQHHAQFVDSFRRLYGELPNSVSALGYDAIMVLADALGRAASITRDGLQQALTSTNRYPGVTGTISINEKRDVLKDVHILKANPSGFVSEDVIAPY